MSTENERKIYSVEEGDVFFTRTSETIEEVGMSSVCFQTIINATFAGFLIRFRPDKTFVNNKYGMYYFNANFLRDYFAEEMNIVTRASLSQGLLKKLPILIPPKEEQIQISDFLDKKVIEIDSLIENKEKLIEELESYKKSLIYEYVTSKKEVI